jgi:GWxTD domain-containing protein
MYYILTDEEFSVMNKGNDRKVFRKLLDYWRAKDPTPFTVYNEAMVEYFRRVDYALFNFKTITEANGSKTERGKIYILNGKPTNIKRNMSKESKIFEIWTYTNLKKEFTFETNSKGSFSLTKIIDLK